MEPAILENTIQSYMPYKDLIEAIKVKPGRLCIPKGIVIDRLALCERLYKPGKFEYPYKDEQGMLTDLIFNSKTYNDEFWLKLTKEDKQLVESYVGEEKKKENVEEVEESVIKNDITNKNTEKGPVNDGKDMSVVKENALHVLEQFGLNSKENIEMVYNKITEIQNSELSDREILIESLKGFANESNLDMLVETIDEVLNNSENRELKRVA